MDAPPVVRIDVWSDYVCPFCWLELPVLERIRREHGAAVEIAWHAFDLRPDPVPTLPPDGPYLRSTWARAVYPLAEERGMTLRLPPVQPRSRKAMEAAEFARDAGRFEALHEALFRAFFEHGRDIGRDEVLVELGREAGLDAAALGEALARGRHTGRVLRDERDAHRLGITGVPMMLLRPRGAPIDEAHALSGAQPHAAVDAVVRSSRGDAPWREPLRLR